MRWKSIKTVMIVILLIVNLWLIHLLVERYMASSYFDAEVLQNTAEILGRDGILLTPEQINAKKEHADIYEASMRADYFDKVAAVFTMSPIHEVFPTPNGVRMIAENLDTISFNQAFGVSFVAAGQERDTLRAVAEWAVRSGDPLDPGQKALRPLREALELRLDADLSESAAGSVRPKLCFDAAYRFGDYTLLRCSQTIDGKPISGYATDSLFDNNGNLLWLDGTWSFLSLTRNYSAQLYDQINILFMEKAVWQEQQTAGEGEVPASLTLASMQLGYSLSRSVDPSTGDSRVFYVPIWQISYTDGTVRAYSAVTGEQIALPGINS